jgi:hypothetical protein
MKLSISLLAALVTVASGFMNQPMPAMVDRSATALFDSRTRQKIEKRSKWIESRGMGGAAPESAAVAVADAPADLAEKDEVVESDAETTNEETNDAVAAETATDETN